MALPKYDELYMPLLVSIQDGKTYTMAEIKEGIAKKLNLTQEELEQRLPSGK